MDAIIHKIYRIIKRSLKLNEHDYIIQKKLMNIHSKEKNQTEKKIKLVNLTTHF